MDTNFYRGGSQFIPFYFIFIYIAPVKETLNWMMYSHVLMFMQSATKQKKDPRQDSRSDMTYSLRLK